MNPEQYREVYQTKTPFPNIVIDHFWPSDLLERCLEEFPKPDSDWWKYNNPLEIKHAKDKLELFPKAIQEFIHMTMRNPFISFLETLTGIQGLTPDHRLNGGGMHSIPHEGKLDIHADYNYHPVTKLDRRLNVIVYLNKDWNPEWGGDLELWNSQMTQKVSSIPPLFNRMVIFNTTDTSFHGHPDPLQCPEGVTRKSIALYYYTNGRPEHERSAPHSTLYQKRPNDPDDPSLDELRAKRSIKRL